MSIESGKAEGGPRNRHRGADQWLFVVGGTGVAKIEGQRYPLNPGVGKSGIEFEREALLMFYNALNEQRHLAGVMLERETDPALKKFLETTKAQLEAHYAKVGALLNRRYFVH